MKKLLVMMLVLTVSVMLFTGCGADAQEQVSESASEAVSEVVSEDVSEEVSEVISEEVSGEVVEEEFYSAEEVMALVDDLIVKYPYNDPEHIKCLVIAANLDYISEEDLNTILTEYGYTLEDLAALYIGENGVLYDATISYWDTYSYHIGTVDSVAEEQRFSNRISLEAIMLNADDIIYASEFEEYLIAASELDGNSEYRAKNYADYTPTTSGEKVVVSFSKYIYDIDREYTPYNDYLNF